MSGPRKRPRVLNGDALHEKVLSAFHNVLQPERPDSEGPKKKSNLPLSFAKRYSKLEVLCEQLVCVSKEEGQSSISQLKKEIQGRACSPAEVATHLFAIDDIDFLPPLCALTSLLENACLRLKDLDQSLILQRAVYEVECAEACVCRGSRTGIRSLINIILDESRGVGQDSLLNTFVSILFNDGAHVSRSLNRIARIKLAEIVLNCLRNETSTHGDRGAMLLSWIRQSSLPSRVASDESNESNSVLSTIVS